MSSSNGTMRAAIFKARERIEIERVPIPGAGPGEVRVRVRACGVCGTDLHFFHMGPAAPGISPGHEIAGEIDAVGDGVDGVSVGDFVAVEPLVSCGTCTACLAGRDSICRECELFGVQRSGGFAEYVSVPAHRVFSLPDDLTPERAALTEPVAVAIHGLRRGGFEPGQRVLVIGAGTVGLLTVLCARALGAGEIWLTARHSHQAELGRALGASRVLMEPELDPFALANLGREAPIQLAVETVGGHANTVGDAAAAVEPGGTVSVVGVFTAPVSVEPFGALTKEVTFAWSNCYARAGNEPDFSTATRLVGEHRDALAALNTRSLPLDAITDAYALAADKKAGAVKVSVLPG